MIKYAAILLFALVLLSNRGVSQSTMNFEQYHVVSPGQPYLYMPVMQYQHAKNWYAEARYNYEDQETFSLYLGKAFTIGKNDLRGSLVPMLGGSVGRFSGISTGLN